jgi:hypothetical protein
MKMNDASFPYLNTQEPIFLTIDGEVPIGAPIH